MMRPFFTFYGGKYRAAPLYPPPRHSSVIEPFAGSAGYALRYHDRGVLLVDADPVIAGLWRYLISATPAEILALPDLEPGQAVRDLHQIPQEARWLIGFWLNKGAAAPMQTPSKWMRDGTRPGSFWGRKIRERIASQVGSIRHWRAVEGSYECAAQVGAATYFIDPPYVGAGKHYRASSCDLDFRALGLWCKTLCGQVMVCENEGATWLPFAPFARTKAREGRGGGKVSREAIWVNE